jgi:hypothetical protein
MERFRVERNQILCGHLNGDVGIFVVLIFGNKFCVLCALITFLSKFLYVLLFRRVSHVYLRFSFI